MGERVGVSLERLFENLGEPSSAVISQVEEGMRQRGGYPYGAVTRAEGAMHRAIDEGWFGTLVRSVDRKGKSSIHIVGSETLPALNEMLHGAYALMDEE